MSEQQPQNPPDSAPPLWGGQPPGYPPGQTGQPGQPGQTGQPTATQPTWGGGGPTGPVPPAWGQPTTLQPGWNGQPAPGGQMPPNGWGQPPGYPPQQAPRRRRKWPWILLAVFVLIGGGIIAIVASLATSVSNQIDKTVTVTYQVTGTAKNATVTYSTWDHGDVSSSQQDVAIPWTQQEKSSGLVKGGDLIVSLGADGGTATCSVSVDGAAPKTATASGAFATATCDVD